MRAGFLVPIPLGPPASLFYLMDELDINPDSPLFNEEIGVDDEDYGLDDFETMNRIRLIEATVNRFGGLPIDEWIAKLSRLEDWVYGLDDVDFEPDTD